jgi:DNA-binding transcriptional MocR family regulator
MTPWTPTLEKRSRHIAEDLADSIAAAIRRGELAAGAKLPPQRQLAWQLKVAVGTVTRAYALVAQRGLVSGEVGSGTYVRGPDGSANGSAATPRPRLEVPVPLADSVVDLSINAALTPAHDEALARALDGLAKSRGLGSLLRYMVHAWQGPHKEAAARWLKLAGLDVPAERIVLTNGAHQGLATAFAALLAPGEPALAEALTYTGIIDNARLFGHPLHGVEVDGEGMVPEALDRAARSTGARVVFVQPTIQNPLVVTMGARRRAEIVAVARRRDLLLVEDDVYGLFPPERPAPIAALAPERTIYVTSASKSIAPGLRIGWMAAPARFIETLTAARYSVTGSLSAVNFEIARRWIEDGTALDLMRRLRADTVQRQKIAREILAGQSIVADPYAFHLLWHLPSPWRREEFAQAALAEGVRIVPISAFVVGQSATSHAVRVSVAAAPDDATLAAALRRLARLAASRAGGSRAVV